jgi:hypothetical protein
VAAHAALNAGLGVMIQRRRRSNLPSLRHSCFDLMALNAGNFLMLRMVEADTEGLGELGRSSVVAWLVARATRRDIASLRLGARRVTAIASLVCIEARGDRQRYTAARRSMTGSATNTFHAYVARVIELHVVTFKRWERLQGA